MVERWKHIKGFDRYQISNMGNVRRVMSDGSYKTVNGTFGVKGYKVFILTANDKTRHTKMQSRLVAEAFVRNIEKRWTVRHKDGDVSNCVYTNLYWGGPSYTERTHDKISRIRK